jgi:hypothetical protein
MVQSRLAPTDSLIPRKLMRVSTARKPSMTAMAPAPPMSGDAWPRRPRKYPVKVRVCTAIDVIPDATTPRPTR